MAEIPCSTETLVFVIRLWREMGAASKGWHGRVEHLPSGEVSYVEDSAGVTRFLERWMVPKDARSVDPDLS